MAKRRQARIKTKKPPKKLQTKKEQRKSVVAKKPSFTPIRSKSEIMRKFTRRVSPKQFISAIVFGTLVLSFFIMVAQYISQTYVISEKTVELVGCVGELNTSMLQLNITNTTLAECFLNLTGCRGDLARCYSNLAASKSNYTACTGQLATCQSEGSSMNSRLTICNLDKTSLQSSLSTCNTDKATCQSSLSTWQANFTATRNKYTTYKCCGATNYTYYYMNDTDVVCTNDGSLSTATTGC